MIGKKSPWHCTEKFLTWIGNCRPVQRSLWRNYAEAVAKTKACVKPGTEKT